MLKIQVLGKGLIPRGYGLAPKKHPFPADLILIETILKTPGLKVRMEHPADGHMVDVTTSNIKKLWAAYSDKYTNDPNRGMYKRNVSRPTVPDKPVDTQVPYVPVPAHDNNTPAVSEASADAAVEKGETTDNSKTEESKETTTVEAKEETKEDNSGNNSQNNSKNNYKNNKHNNGNFKPIQNPNRD